MNTNCYVREALPQVRDIPPREKYNQSGVQSLLDGELLMLFLDIPEQKASRVLEKNTLSDLLSIPQDGLGKLLGKGRTARLLCGLEIVQRALQKGLGVLPIVSCPAEVLPFLSGIRNKDKEHFLCLYLNARNQAIHQEVISIGSLSASIVHPREVFHVALQHSAASIILAHNHPSGDPSPSKDDIELTRRLGKAGEIIGIEIIDHIIVGHRDFLSMKEKGLI